jgi:hypothetical protein
MDSNSIHLLHIEAESVRRDTSRAFEAAETAAENLKHAAVAAFDAATTDAFVDGDAEALAARAERLRGAALHVLTVTADLARCAGRLEQLAVLRRAEVPD